LPKVFDQGGVKSQLSHILRIKSAKGAVEAGFEVFCLDKSVNIRLSFRVKVASDSSNSAPVLGEISV
jgi:hypothetical protein